MKLILINWVDSSSSDGWQYLDSAKEHHPSNCRTVGWLLTKTKDYVTVAATQCDSELWSQLMSIPRKCITNIRIIE